METTTPQEKQQFDIDGMVIWANSIEEALDIANLAIIDPEERFPSQDDLGQDVLRWQTSSVTVGTSVNLPNVEALVP